MSVEGNFIARHSILLLEKVSIGSSFDLIGLFFHVYLGSQGVSSILQTKGIESGISRGKNI
jgi:hypothetical protein